MKQLMRVSLIIMLIVTLHGITFAQTETTTPPAQATEHTEHTPQTAEQPPMMPQQMMAMMLEHMATMLGQQNVSPETMKQMSEEMKQMAQMMKQMPGMAESSKMTPMKPMMMDKMAGDMSGMMCGQMMEKMKDMKPKMMENMAGGMMDCKKMMAMKPKMMPDKPMPEMDPMMQMMPMMPMMAAKHDPKTMGLMMQMRGEMMKAMGDIMLKYGKLMAEESATAAQPAEVSIEQSANTATYEVAFKIGPMEKMLTPEETKTATEGEVMTGGEMAMSMPGMPLTHHVEVSVKDLKSGAVITDKPVTIRVTNDATKHAENIPVATMYGLDEGVAGTHFGNNVMLSPGAYTIVVTIGEETATFNVTIPAS
jgi:hypothetical protein